MRTILRSVDRSTLSTEAADLEAIQSQHQAAVRFAEQSELHAVLAGKSRLDLRCKMGPREWREWVTKAKIPATVIAKYIRKAEAFAEIAYVRRGVGYHGRR